MRQTGRNSDHGKTRTVRTSTAATKGLMPESYAGTIKETLPRRLWDRMVG